MVRATAPSSVGPANPSAAPMSRIDSHHHFWNFDPADYGWIASEQTVLRRDFGPADLHHEIRAAGIDGTIAVQARQSLAETDWLLELAGRHDFIRGVVGWAPLIDPKIAITLGHLAKNPKLRGLRHVLQDEPDDRYMLRDDFNRGIAVLRGHDLVYDILIHARHLPQTIEFVDRHPAQVFVLDHLAKPKIKAGELEPWRTHIRELARRPNVYCKVSGMVTEAGHHTWAESQLWPFFDTVVEAFTPQRLMFGSDWPVCRLACGYTSWLETVEMWMDVLTDAEQARILGGTARDAYGL